MGLFNKVKRFFRNQIREIKESFGYEGDDVIKDFTIPSDSKSTDSGKSNNNPQMTYTSDDRKGQENDGSNEKDKKREKKDSIKPSDSKSTDSDKSNNNLETTYTPDDSKGPENDGVDKDEVLLGKKDGGIYYRELIRDLEQEIKEISIRIREQQRFKAKKTNKKENIVIEISAKPDYEIIPPKKYSPSNNDYKVSLLQIHYDRTSQLAKQLQNELEGNIESLRDSHQYGQIVDILQGISDTLLERDSSWYLEEIKKYSKKKEDYFKSQVTKLEGIKNNLKNKEVVTSIRLFENFKNEFTVIDKTLLEEVLEIEKNVSHLKDNNRKFENEVRRFKKFLKDEDFTKSKLSIQRLKSHSFTDQIESYKQKVTSLEQDLELVISNYIKRKIKQIRSLANSNIPKALKLLRQTIISVSGTEDLRKLKEELNQKLDEQKKKEKEEKAYLNRVLKKVNSLYKNKDYREIIYYLKDNNEFKKYPYPAKREIELFQVKAEAEIERISKLTDTASSLLKEISDNLKKNNSIALRRSLDKIISSDEILGHISSIKSLEKRIATIAINLFSYAEEKYDLKEYENTKRWLSYCSKRPFINYLSSPKIERINSSCNSSIEKEIKNVKIKNLLRELENFQGNARIYLDKLSTLKDLGYDENVISLKRKLLTDSFIREAEQALRSEEYNKAEQKYKEAYNLGLVNKSSFNTNISSIKSLKEEKEKARRIRPSITFLGTYYPGWYKEKTREMHEFNRMIYNFKDGEYNPSLNQKICDLIKKEIYPLDSDVMFCVIPASTYEKNRNRFYEFSKIISKKLGVINGFDAIKVVEDREQGKGIRDKNVLSVLSFDATKIRNKEIILFDDVITHGTSFKQLRGELKSLGARNVCGVFIGATYGTREFNRIKHNRDI